VKAGFYVAPQGEAGGVAAPAAGGAIGAGHGAWENALGRLYRWAQIGFDRRVAAHGFLAPTVWTPYAAGPCVVHDGGAEGAGSCMRWR
jgi:hypothetical protein